MDHKRKVLIVDDESLNAMAMGAFLEEQGFHILGFASTGEEAISVAQEDQPDLIFMDIRLPGVLDGLEAARVIHQDRPVPIIIISGYTEKVLGTRDLGFTPVAFLSKPVNDDDLIKILGSL